MRRLAFTLAAVTLGACGLSVTGIAVTGQDDVVTPEGGPLDVAAPDVTPPGTENDTGVVPDADVTPADASPDASDAAADAGTDAAVDAGDAAVDAGKVDAGGDAGANCTVLLDQKFDAPLTNWTPAGNPPGLDMTAKVFRLTNRGDDTESGAVWYTQQLTFGAILRASVEFEVDPTSTSGTGISLVWGQNASFGVGGSSFGLGICGAGIVAVAAQYRFDGRVYAVTSTDGNCGTNGNEAVQTGNDGTLQLTLTSSTVSAQIDNVTHGPRAATLTKSGYIGVTASTDNTGRSGIAIRSVRVVSCTP